MKSVDPNRELIKLDEVLYAMLGSWELVERWWKSPNKAFDMKQPGEVWCFEEGGRDKVYSYIMGQAGGQYG